MVYKARDTKRKRRLVAIKQIDLATLSPRQMIEATDSYNREVTILSQLQHRNLVSGTLGASTRTSHQRYRSTADIPKPQRSDLD